LEKLERFDRQIEERFRMWRSNIRKMREILRNLIENGFDFDYDLEECYLYVFNLEEEDVLRISDILGISLEKSFDANGHFDYYGTVDNIPIRIWQVKPTCELEEYEETITVKRYRCKET